MAVDFIKFRRIMAKLDAQLKKEEAERKAKKDNKKKEKK
jgi:hypothetical protein